MSKNIFTVQETLEMNSTNSYLISKNQNNKNKWLKTPIVNFRQNLKLKGNEFSKTDLLKGKLKFYEKFLKIE